MQNILVTGGLGFLGQHLICALLERNPDFNITVLDKVKADFFDSRLNGKSNIKVINDADITNINSLDEHFRGIDVVFHVAAMISFWSKDKDELNRVNIGGADNIISMCLKHNVQKLIYVSSTAALGFNNDKDHPVDENYDYNWDKATGFHYMLSKYHAEQKIKQACRDGLSVMIANPSTMFGPWDRKIFPLIENVLSGKLPAMLPGGFSIIDVRDTASALVTMLDNGRPGENYLLIGGNYTYRDMLSTLAEVLEVSPPSKTLPSWLGPIIVPIISLIERMSSKQPKLTKEILAPGFKFRYYNCDKAKNELGWKPQKALKDTFQDAYDFYKSQLV